jgi:hypothetical protein
MAQAVKLTLLRTLKEDETAPPQVMAFLSRMKVGEPIDRDKLGDLATQKDGDKPVMVTKQAPGRVIAYYQAKLVEAGILREERAGKNNIVARTTKGDKTEPTAPADKTKGKDKSAA